MVNTIVVPGNYGYVALAACSMAWLNVFQSRMVGNKRKVAGVAYPQMYADKAQQEASKDAFVFNCAQRAHGNTLEWLPTALFALLFTGLKYPLFAAGAGAAITIGRGLYTVGYVNYGPGGRNLIGGMVGHMASMALYAGSTWSAIKMIMDQKI